MSKSRRSSKPQGDAVAGSYGESLLNDKPRVINVGLSHFAEELAEQGTPVIQVVWSPPACGDVTLAALLAKLLD